MADNQQPQTTVEQKRSIAPFIIGLAIGGILIWIFAANSSRDANVAEDTDTNTPVVSTSTSNTALGGTSTTPTKVTTSKPATVSTTGDGSVSVSDQPAGMVVKINSVTYPAARGWIAVQEDRNGQPGNALGVARWGGGLDPREIELLRATVKGGTYYVVLRSEDGDKIYNSKIDLPIEKNGAVIKATFKAQ